MIKRYHYLILFNLCLFLCSLNAETQLKQTITLAQHSVHPLAGKSLVDGGVIPNLVRDIFAKHNIKLTIHWAKPANSYNEVKSGKADFSLGWLKTNERMQQLIYSQEPLLRSSTLLYHLKSTDFSWRTLKDLKKYKIGKVTGSTSRITSELYTDVTNQKSIIWAPNTEQNVRNLLDGKVDIILGGPIPMKSLITHVLSKAEAGQITAHIKPLSSRNYYAIFNKKTPKELINIFNTGMEETRKSGEYYRLINKALNR